MNKNNGSHVTNVGVGFTGLLTIVFVTLKLCGVIDWPWVWVLCPIWAAPFLFAFLFVVLLLAIFILGRY